MIIVSSSTDEKMNAVNLAIVNLKAKYEERMRTLEESSRYEVHNR